MKRMFLWNTVYSQCIQCASVLKDSQLDSVIFVQQPTVVPLSFWQDYLRWKYM